MYDPLARLHKTPPNITKCLVCEWLGIFQATAQVASGARELNRLRRHLQWFQRKDRLFSRLHPQNVCYHGPMAQKFISFGGANSATLTRCLVLLDSWRWYCTSGALVTSMTSARTKSLSLYIDLYYYLCHSMSISISALHLYLYLYLLVDTHDLFVSDSCSLPFRLLAVRHPTCIFQ